MQDFQNGGNGEEENESESSFSWKTEKDEAMQNYKSYAPEKTYKYEPMPKQYSRRERQDSIFYSDSFSSQRGEAFRGVRYDYPGEDSVYDKYSPEKTYGDSLFYDRNTTSAQRNYTAPSRPRRSNDGRVKHEPVKGKKKKSANPSKKSSASSNAKPQSKNGGGKKRKAKKNILVKAIGKIAGRQKTKSSNVRQSQREYERERRQEEARRKKVERSNQSYNNEKAKGFSGDEIRKKRSKKAKRTGRFYVVLSAAVLFLFAVCSVLIFCFVHGAPIETIVIEGSTIYKEQQILSAAGIAKGDNMFRIRQNKTNRAISTALPYIKYAEVDYELPSTLKLTITETNEKYLIVNGKGATDYICIDSNGKVVSDKKKKIEKGNYRIDGFERQEFKVGEAFVPSKENEQRYEIVKKLTAAIESSGIKKCSIIDVSNTDELCITCDSKIKIYVFADDDLERRLTLASLAIESKVKSGGKYYIDLRYSNSAIINDGELK